MQLARVMGGGLPCPFLKIEIKCPDFRNKKCPDCVNLRVRFLIWNAVLKVSWRKKLWNFSLRSLSFMCFRRNVYRSALIPRNLYLPWKILVWASGSSLYPFGMSSSFPSTSTFSSYIRNLWSDLARLDSHCPNTLQH